MELKISYLGGIEDKEKGYSITGSATLFELINKHGEKLVRVLVDYGAFQGSKSEKLKNKEIDIEDIHTLDAIIVTHAHLDHVGRVPYLVKKGFKGNIYVSPLTLELAKLNWKDSIGIAKIEAKKNKHFKTKIRDYLKIKKLNLKLKNNSLKKYEKEKIVLQLNKLLGKYKVSVENVIEKLEEWGVKRQSDIANVKQNDILFDEIDIQKTLELVSVLTLHDEAWINEFLRLKFLNSAHIEGSIIPVLDFYNEEKQQYRCLIAQDLGRFKNNPLEQQPQIPRNLKPNYIQLETTYAGRYHPEMEKSIEHFVEAICNHKGPILIPAFSIQRTQYILKLLLENIDKFKGRKIYTTSELANQVSKILLSRKKEKYSYLSSKKIKFLSIDENLPKKSLDKAIIIGSSGMLQGGSIERWLKMLVKNPKAKIIFTGYQGEGTRGREILNGKDFVVIDGEAIPVRCSYEYIEGFSSHADTNDLLAFLKKFKRNNRKKIKLVLTHGGDNRYVFKELLYSKDLKKVRKQYDIYIAKIKESLVIEF